MTEYIQVDRDQLRVGMRFDYRGERDQADWVQRKLTGLDPIEYDMTNQRATSPQPVHVVLEPGDITSDTTFWVHPDDLKGAESRDAQAVAAYERGVKVGRQLAAQERQDRSGTYSDGYEAGRGARRTLQDAQAARQAAIALAVQYGGEGELIGLAKRIEAYVNGTDEQEAAPKTPDFPTIIETAEQAALAWPEGTQVTDKDGDTWSRGDDSGYEPFARDGWKWGAYTVGTVRLDQYLPATVTRLGTE